MTTLQLGFVVLTVFLFGAVITEMMRSMPHGNDEPRVKPAIVTFDEVCKRTGLTLKAGVRPTDRFFACQNENGVEFLVDKGAVRKAR